MFTQQEIDSMGTPEREAYEFGGTHGILELATDDIGLDNQGMAWLIDMKEQYDRDGTKAWLAEDAG